MSGLYFDLTSKTEADPVTLKMAFEHKTSIFSLNYFSWIGSDLSGLDSVAFLQISKRLLWNFSELSLFSGIVHIRASVDILLVSWGCLQDIVLGEVQKSVETPSVYSANL